LQRIPHPPQYARRCAIEHAAGGDRGWAGRTTNITRDPGTGIGKWEKEDVVELLRTGTTPEQSKVKGAMRETLQEGLKYLSDFDLDAIADYLFAQPPIVHEVRPKR
jgi:hypothetical protein